MNILNRELGPRIRLMCALPNGRKFPHIIDILETKLARQFGGFTRSPMLGGWVDPDTDKMKTEAGYIYHISVMPGFENVEKVCYLFRQAGQYMGERWIHIEETDTIAHHVQVNK